MPDITHMVHAADLGVATRPFEASRLLMPSADPTLLPDSPSPATNSTDPPSLHCQPSPQTILKQWDGGTTASSASQGTQQEAASALAQPVCSSSSGDDSDALQASCHDHQPLDGIESSAAGLSLCGGRLGGKAAGETCRPQQSSSLQHDRNGSGLVAVCLQVDDGDGISLALNLGKQFASVIVSALPFLRASPPASACPCASCLSLCLASPGFPSILPLLDFPLPCPTFTSVLLLFAQKSCCCSSPLSCPD